MKVYIVVITYNSIDIVERIYSTHLNFPVSPRLVGSTWSTHHMVGVGG